MRNPGCAATRRPWAVEYNRFAVGPSVIPSLSFFPSSFIIPCSIFDIPPLIGRNQTDVANDATANNREWSQPTADGRAYNRFAVTLDAVECERFAVHADAPADLRHLAPPTTIRAYSRPFAVHLPRIVAGAVTPIIASR